MKKEIKARIAQTRVELQEAKFGEHYSDYDYLQGAIAAYKEVLQLLDKQDKEK